MKRLTAFLFAVLLLAACANVYVCSGENGSLTCFEVQPVTPEPLPTATPYPVRTVTPTPVPTLAATPLPVYLPSAEHGKIFTQRLVDELGDAIVEWVSIQLDDSVGGN